MQDIRDCKDHLTCRGDAKTGRIEAVYRGCLTRTWLPPGAMLEIERGGVITKITRTKALAFLVDSYMIAG